MRVSLTVALNVTDEQQIIFSQASLLKDFVMKSFYLRCLGLDF